MNSPAPPKLRLLDLFSGIGGFSLGLERSGYFETVAFCEIEEYPRRVLKKHWPEVPCYEDVRTLTADTLSRDGIEIDAICGGFPCQDLSIAGKRGGIEAERSGLWSEFARLIGELRPRVVFVENVANLLSGPSEQRGGWFGKVLGDLASIGYDAEWERIPAWWVGSPQKRERVFVLSYPNNNKPAQLRGVLGNKRKWFSDNIQGTAWTICGERGGSRLDGVSARLVANAVVPQIPEALGRAWGEAMKEPS